MGICFFGTAEGIRTPDLLVRSQTKGRSGPTLYKFRRTRNTLELLDFYTLIIPKPSSKSKQNFLSLLTYC